MAERPVTLLSSRPGPTCVKCRNHGKPFVPLKDHKKICPYKNCECDKCELIKRRAHLNHKRQVLIEEKYPPKRGAGGRHAGSSKAYKKETIKAQSSEVLDCGEKNETNSVGLKTKNKRQSKPRKLSQDSTNYKNTPLPSPTQSSLLFQREWDLGLRPFPSHDLTNPQPFNYFIPGQSYSPQPYIPGIGLPGQHMSAPNYPPQPIFDGSAVYGSHSISPSFRPKVLTSSSSLTERSAQGMVHSSPEVVPSLEPSVVTNTRSLTVESTAQGNTHYSPQIAQSFKSNVVTATSSLTGESARLQELQVSPVLSQPPLGYGRYNGRLVAPRIGFPSSYFDDDQDPFSSNS